MPNFSSPLPDSTTPNALPHPLLTRPLVLIGLMGAGKTSIGKRVAERLGVPFVDSDEAIEEAAGCSISDIFAVHGESIFRDLEERVIARLLKDQPIVLATGGGAWMQPAIRARIKTHGTSLWLRADLEVLLARVARRNHRPLLETGDKRTTLARLMEARYPVYAEADLVVDSGFGSQERVVRAVLEALHPPTETV